MMRNLLLIVALLLTFEVQAQFEKTSNAEKIGSYDLGNYHLYKLSIDNETIYCFDMRDRKYSSRNYLSVCVGNKQDAITFFRNAITTVETAKKGDSFDLGLPDGNTGFFKNDVGARSLGIYAGRAGAYGLIRKTILANMLEDIQKQPDDILPQPAVPETGKQAPSTADTEHLKFAGIEITGTLQDFTSQLLAKGYKPTDSTNISFTGTFAGRTCEIMVATNENENIVSQIFVSTEPENSWTYLSSQFCSFVEIYTKKYGSPKQLTQEFEYPFNGTTDQQMIGVKAGLALYIARWELPNGNIMIYIDKDCCIHFNYTDKVNYEAGKAQKGQRTYDEI